ncbi:MAG: Hint domain-containing protein [Pseudomonadota bacterium]
MGTGFDGTFVLTIDQTSLDGRSASRGMWPRIGQVWCRQGEAIRVDGSQSTLLLERSVEQDALRARVAQVVRKRFDLPQSGPSDVAHQESAGGFVVADGQSRFSLVPIEAERSGKTLLWCPDGVPAADRNYTVVHVPENPVVTRSAADLDGDVICFTEGTRIRTESGHKLVEALAPGDYVQTMDNGPQQVLWIGTRHMSGARLHAVPELRPIRITAGALKNGVPDGDLLVSPHHRMLYQGPSARVLFNTDEVLVRAQDMLNDHSIFIDHSLREVTYYHLLLADHQILWANGVPTESFHPASTSLTAIHPDQRETLIAHFPELDEDLHSYGPYARRNTAKSEAAIMLHDMM